MLQSRTVYSYLTVVNKPPDAELVAARARLETGGNEMAATTQVQ